MERDCYFESNCQTNEECEPCGLLCVGSPGQGKRCTTENPLYLEEEKVRVILTIVDTENRIMPFIERYISC